jgi:hypothetical protein
MRLDAYKIYCDEAYHALFSEDIFQQIQALSEVDYCTPRHGPRPDPTFLGRYADSVAGLKHDDLDLAETIFVITSETLITKTLARVPGDERVITAVRQMMADHAQDESLHHQFFSQLLHLLWPRLSARQRELANALIPQFIQFFLTPDLDAYDHGLSCLGLHPEERKIALREAYTPANIAAAIADASLPALRGFRAVGALT